MDIGQNMAIVQIYVEINIIHSHFGSLHHVLVPQMNDFVGWPDWGIAAALRWAAMDGMANSSNREVRWWTATTLLIRFWCHWRVQILLTWTTFIFYFKIFG